MQPLWSLRRPVWSTFAAILKNNSFAFQFFPSFSNEPSFVSPVENNGATLEHNGGPLGHNTAPLERNTVPLGHNAAPLEDNTAPLEYNAAPLGA